MSKIIDKLCEFGKRIQIGDKNSDGGIPRTRGDIAADDEFNEGCDDTALKRGRRRVRGIWRGHIDEIPETTRKSSQIIKSQTQQSKSLYRQNAQNRRNAAYLDTRPMDLQTYSVQTRDVQAYSIDPKESLAWCRLLYNRTYSTSTATSSSGSPFEKSRRRRRCRRVKSTKSLATYAGKNCDSDESLNRTGYTDSQVDQNARQTKPQRIRRRQSLPKDTTYTTLYIPDKRAATCRRSKDVTSRGDILEMARQTRDGCLYDSKPNTLPRHHQVVEPISDELSSGQLNLKIVSQERQLTVKILKISGLLASSTESSVYLRLSLRPDCPEKERYKTKVISVSDSAATFDEDFIFNVPDEETSRRVLISAWQIFNGLENSEFIGCMSFSVRKLVQRTKIIDGWYQLLGETLGRRKHLVARIGCNKENEDFHKVDTGRLTERQSTRISSEKAIEDYYKNYFSVQRSPKVRFRFESQSGQENRESSCDTVKTTRTYRQKYHSQSPNARPTAMRRWNSESRKQREQRKTPIRRSPHRLKRKKPRAHAESPKFVTDAKVVKSYRAKSARIVSRRHNQLRLRGNINNIKVLYTDEKECATQQAGIRQIPVPTCEEVAADKNKDCIKHSSKSTLIHCEKDHEIRYLTISSTVEGKKEEMPSTIQMNAKVSDTLLKDDSRFEHLTMSKSGRVREKKHLSRSPTFLHASQKRDEGDDGATNHHAPDEDGLKKESASNKRERIYATIGEVMGEGYIPKEPATTSPSANSQESETMKNSVRYRSATVPDSSSVPSDLNLNLSPSRKRNSNTDSGIYVQLESAEAETRVAEICSLKEERKKIAKVQTTRNGEIKTNEKENKQPMESIKASETKRILPTRSNTFANAKRTFAKKSFRQTKKMSSLEDAKQLPEFTFEDMLKNKNAMQAFRDFLKSEYSVENLDFWLDCESYKTLKGQKLLKMAVTIFAQYLARSAPREVNLEAGIITRTEQRMKNPDKQTFVEAQNAIYSLMKTDSFKRFLASGKYTGNLESNEGLKLNLKRSSTKKK